MRKTIALNLIERLIQLGLGEKEIIEIALEEVTDELEISKTKETVEQLLLQVSNPRKIN
jgi:hypothetical protein